MHECLPAGLCLYVRREIRSLRSDDLTSFLDSSHVLWEYGDSEGRQRFGEDFKTNSFLLGFHQVVHPTLTLSPVLLSMADSIISCATYYGMGWDGMGWVA